MNREKESRRLSALFDGELSQQLSEELRYDLAAKGVSVENTLEEYRVIRQELRNLMRERSVNEVGERVRSVDLWSRIEPRIRKQAAQREVAGGLFWLRSWFVASLEGFRDFWRSSRSQRVLPLVGGFVTACFVGLIVFGGFRPSDLDGSGRLSSKQELNLSRSPATLGVPVLVVSDRTAKAYRDELGDLAHSMLSRALSERSGSTGQFVYDTGRDQRSREFGDSGSIVHLPLGRIIDRNFVLGGLRAEGADIHWVRSSKSVELVTTANRREPPVLWVARQESAERAIR